MFTVNLTVGGIMNKTASTFIRVAQTGTSATRPFIPASRGFIRNTHAVRDATRVTAPIILNQTFNQ